MPLRSTPTARQERLGAELRNMRESAGVTARDTASLLGVDPAKVSHIEAGRLGVSEERLRRLATFYSCGDTALVDALAAITHEQRGQGWWEEYRGVLPAPLLDLSEVEHHCAYLNTVQITDVPGLPQTEEYARAVFGHTIPRLPAAELDARVEHRMARQRAFLERECPRYEAVLHEAALRMRLGGRRVLRAQLGRLLEHFDRPGVVIRVIPFTAETYTGANRAMLYAGGPVPQLDTVQIEAAHGVAFLGSPAHLAKYRALFRDAGSAALGATESRELIHDLAQAM
ncbi:helix-turn-helix transcriptional regulator [Streptomyces sp. NPDC048845]|uniref:helix-turn-helix domain-containing protein n=1 Tax=Streptomyces sp. NPDC048845 TaxID=3155390 RepID=UPI003437604E